MHARDVSEHKGVAYFKNWRDAQDHLEKHCPSGFVRSYGRGFAVQTKNGGPYLNKAGEIESC
jgi:hypothetical protein